MPRRQFRGAHRRNRVTTRSPCGSPSSPVDVGSITSLLHPLGWVSSRAWGCEQLCVPTLHSTRTMGGSGLSALSSCAINPFPSGLRQQGRPHLQTMHTLWKFHHTSPASCWAWKNSIITDSFLRDSIWGEPMDAEEGIRMHIRNNSFSKGVVMHWHSGLSPSFEVSQHFWGFGNDDKVGMGWA